MLQISEKRKMISQVSLSVQKANYAARMYEKLGFETVEDKEEEYIMVCIQGGYIYDSFSSN